MSDLFTNDEQKCDLDTSCSAIELLIQPKDKDLGGFSVRRLLPTKERKMVGPWIFFDHMGPAQFSADNGVNVRPHPHINLATVTYLFEGEILHRDSLGSYQTIQPGDINLMVAGKGIVHSERERPEVYNSSHALHGLQLWLALPEKDEEIDPAFYHYPSSDIPATNIAGVSLRVMMGSAYGITSPVKVFANTLYVEARLQAGQSLVLPEADERAVYIVSGKAKARDTILEPYSMAIFANEKDIVIEAIEDTKIAIIGGENIGTRYIEWNFVSSRKERIQQAKGDWKAGRFPKVLGDEQEFIPLPA